MWAKSLVILGMPLALCAGLISGTLAAELAPSPSVAQAPKTDSKDSLFGDVPPVAGAEKPPAETSRGWAGYIAAEIAHDYKSPEHWSNARLRAEASRQGQFNSNVKWKIGARADYDAAYDRSGFYPA